MKWFSSTVSTRSRTAHHCLRPLRLLARFWPEDYAMFEGIAIPRGEDLVSLDAVVLSTRRLLLVCLESEVEALQPRAFWRRGEEDASLKMVRKRAAAQVSALSRFLEVPVSEVSVVLSAAGSWSPPEGSRPVGVVLGDLRKRLEDSEDSVVGWNQQRFEKARASLQSLAGARQRKLARLVLQQVKSCRG